MQKVEPVKEGLEAGNNDRDGPRWDGLRKDGAGGKDRLRPLADVPELLRRRLPRSQLALARLEQVLIYESGARHVVALLVLPEDVRRVS